jgi:5'-nucleotidase
MLKSKRLGKISFLSFLSLLMVLSLATSTLAAKNGIPTNTDNYTNRYIDVQLLGINDFHGCLDQSVKVSGKDAGGAAYLAAYLKQREAENKNTLMVHAGDMVGASLPVSALLQDEPTIEFLNMTGFDVGVPGNHEFDEGTDEMLRLINGGYHEATGYFEGADFPYVSANIVYKDSGKSLLPPYVVKKVNGMPIAFIGVTLKETPSLVIPSAVAGLEFTDEATAVNKAVAELKQNKIETIVVLAHMEGYEAAGTVTGELGELAENIDDEVDVIIAGHSHLGINQEVDGKLIVEAYSRGQAFSDIDLQIDPVSKDVVSKKAEIVTTYHEGIEPDAETAQLISYYEDLVASIMSEVIATAKDPITRTPSDAGESAMGNLIADAQRWEMGTDFAFVNPGSIRADIEAGPVTWEDLFHVQPFGNNLVKMTLTGTQIRALLNQQFDANKMLQIAGLKYTWKNDAVVDIYSVAVDGTTTPLDDTANYTVTVNNYLAGGGDGFTVLQGGTDPITGPEDLEALIDYLQQLPQPFDCNIEGRITQLS